MQAPVVVMSASPKLPSTKLQDLVHTVLQRSSTLTSDLQIPRVVIDRLGGRPNSRISQQRKRKPELYLQPERSSEHCNGILANPPKCRRYHSIMFRTQSNAEDAAGSDGRYSLDK
jgi:hypothetical protein